MIIINNKKIKNKKKIKLYLKCTYYGVFFKYLRKGTLSVLRIFSVMLLICPLKKYF